MAIIVPGLSRCAFCDNVITTADVAAGDVRGFPDFVPDPSSPFAYLRLFDAPAHETCFQDWPGRDAFLRFLAGSDRHAAKPRARGRAQRARRARKKPRSRRV